MDVLNVFESLGHAEIDEGTAAALGLEDGRRSAVRGDQLVQALGGSFGFGAEFRSQLDVAAAFGFDVKDSAGGDGHAEHLFEAKGLGAELHVVVVPLFAFAPFVLDGEGNLWSAGLRVEFDDIGLADQPQPIALEPHAMYRMTVTALPIDGPIGASVGDGP